MGLLSALIAGAIGLPVVLSLPYDPNKSFAVGGIVIILEVFFLLIWVKASKVTCLGLVKGFPVDRPLISLG